MSTVESVKCRICGARYAADAAVCPTCGTKARRPTAGSASAGKSRPEPYRLDSEALLAKIDALDWEDPTIQAGAAAAAKAAEPPPTKRSVLLPFLAGFIVLLVGMIAVRYYSGGSTAPVAPIAVAEAPPVAPTSVEAAPPAPAAEPATLAVPVSGTAAAPAQAEAAEKAKREEARRHRAEMRRKALAAKQALEEQNRLERMEQEKQRAEKAAADARAKAAAAAAATSVPKVPSSPQEVCAGEASAFGIAACEARTCAQTQWRSHPFCIKRWQDELRKLSPSSAGGV